MLRVLVISLILLTQLTSPAKAEEDLTRANVVIGLLQQAGIDNQNVHSAVYFTDKHVSGGYVDILKHDVLGVSMKLRHELATPDVDNLELQFQDKNSPY